MFGRHCNQRVIGFVSGFLDVYKRQLQAGADADIVVYDPLADHVIRAADTVANVDYNPYEGFTTRGSIQQVWLRGRLAVEHGTVLAGPDGKYILRGKNCL